MAERGFPNHSIPSSFDGDDKFMNENGWAKVSRKLREEPLVPLGAALTVYALVNASRALRRGDSAGAQRMFRARVLAQGFTIVAIVAGGMYYSQDRARSAELRKLNEQQAAEEKRAKWIQELEARDEEDKAFRARLEKKRDAQEANGGKEGGVLAALGRLNEAKGADAEAMEQEAQKTTRNRNPRSSLDALGDIVGSKKPSLGDTGAPDTPTKD
ncbi:related to Respiratory supercomplex factor 1, mitochondrial [Cephalotrichum gorgonifer]|uniref:Related to Respiratory supercomplex factor 1, mitochondrial n=1 Tax=Cephalotrichum gorgonifer TaxID=2041049 RepID=A0AAE8MZG5_9PEZI|nr:related to Respiratory supercomplex factor 1, mitochondrial [Cephalotrichum gorgonifer]